MSAFVHQTVLLEQSVEALVPTEGQVYVDCTLGGGGHTEALLDAADCRVIGVDRDPAALAAASARLARFGDRFTPVRGSFGQLATLLDGLGIAQVDGLLADLGVSSHQIDTAERGFSFRFSGPIDMRMDPEAPLSAADLVNTWTERELCDVIRRYGEERKARRIASVICEDRPFTDTAVLAETIARVVGRGEQRIHPATRTFQALRIVVNDELGELETLLEVALQRVRPGGRIAVISFHSLEDRIVKRFFAAQSGKSAPRDPYGNPIGVVTLDVLPSVIPPESDPNPRARSARLRVAVRLP